MPTRLSELKSTQVEIIVEDGIIETKRAIISSSHHLSYKIRIPMLATEVRRKDEEFDMLE